MQRMPRTGIVSNAGLWCLLAALPVPGQLRPVPEQDADKVAAREAVRHIRMLELPDKRAAAAQALLALGSKAVPSIVRCLDDPRPEVVERLMLVLHILRGDALPAVPALKKLAAGDDQRIARAARWGLARFEPEGVILVTESGGDTYELNPKREVSLRLPGSKNAFHAERLPNGNYLVTILNKQLVQEVDPKGEVVWKIDTVKSPTAATRLPSDHTLICSLQDKEVVEVDRKGKVVWRHRCNTPYSAERLANGNTLIADYSGQETFEVSPEGRRVWTYKELGGPLEAQRLANGNTLITSHSSRAVHEVTPQGEVVLKIQLPSSGWTGRRLPSGDTLVGGGNYLICFDAKGQERWRHNGVKTVTSLRCY